jgi:hypothetical protein
MNTLIQQLAEQAAEFAVTEPIDMNLESESEDQKVIIPATFIEKFAELLVKECSRLIETMDPRSEPADHIYLLKTFGLLNEK